MIQYSLKCAEGHSFDSWFQSASAFDALQKAGHLSCAICASTDVSKAIMAPRVTSSRQKSAQQAAAPSVENDNKSPDKNVANMQSEDVQRVLSELRKHVEANSDYVGDSFAKDARAMYLGEIPEKSIYGEVAPDDAKALVDDGVPIVPLPFTPTRKTN